jgi:hypothetical protein
LRAGRNWISLRDIGWIEVHHLDGYFPSRCRRSCS